MTEPLGMSPDRLKHLQTELAKYQIEFQAAGTKNSAMRGQLRAMYRDPEKSTEEIRTFFAERVQPATQTQMRIRLEARLFVRNTIPTEALAKLTTKHPRFFGQRWFRQSKVPVIKGKVK
ncbi:hypothetical protein [Sulfidibacter corallicola]|uniref:Uncharacterized protein n=1 Tax=Sulfidibacter corallicola TaxID=2818388 RepID=A0A8A4TPK4_SULCO|nr:hypothetical protein [Sulfidibacter corallicola]QTD51480.1 hypothetical protein J3U87_03340 [Sulfidibacter corallicola]